MTVAAPSRVLVLLGHGASVLRQHCLDDPAFSGWQLFAFDEVGHGWPDPGPEPGPPASTPVLCLLLAAQPGNAAAAHTEDRWRTLLAAHGLAHGVVYPDTNGHADALRRACGLAARPPHQTLKRWACDACSDSDCEHRLFQDLLAQQALKPPVTGLGRTLAAVPPR